MIVLALVSRGSHILLPKLGRTGRYIAFGIAALVAAIVFACVFIVLVGGNAEKDFDALYAKANDCVSQHNFKQAVDLYNQALSKIGNSKDKGALRIVALIDLSKTYLELDQTDDAAKACSEALLLMRQTYNLQGTNYEKRDELSVARASLLLGRIYRKQEKYREAEGAFRNALKLEEDCLGPLYLKDDIIQSYAELLKHVHRDADAARLTRSNNESYFSVYEQTSIATHLIDKGRVKDGVEMLKETAKFAVDNNLINQETITCLYTLASFFQHS